MRFHLRPTGLAAALLLLGASALAQQPPAPPTPPGPMAPAAARPLPPPPEADAARSTLDGRLQQWLLNPNGDIDGLLLADGTQVAFPPHLSAAVQRMLKPGDRVQVSGWRAPEAPVLRAASLSANGHTVADQPPARADTPPPPRERGALAAMSASGRVSRLLYTDRGDVHGVLLDDGSIVRFPPHAGAALAPTLQPGSTVSARGWGSRGPLGSALEATAIGGSADSMRELFAGPGVEPPRGPHGPRARGERGERGPRARPAPPVAERPMPVPPAPAS